MPHPVPPRTQTALTATFPVTHLLKEAGIHYAVAKIGGVFHAIRTGEAYPSDPKDPEHPVAVHNASVGHYVEYYSPPHPSMTVAKINGATHARDDGKYWHFDKGHITDHYDHEELIRSAVVARFRDEEDLLIMDCMVKLHSLVRARPGNAQSNASSQALAARVKWDNMVEFRKLVVDCSLKGAREYPIGHLGQAIDVSHINGLIVKCLEKAIFIHRFTQSAKYYSVAGEIGRILTALKDRHAYETRNQRAARIEAERLARLTKEAAETADE